jgi:protein TonB
MNDYASQQRTPSKHLVGIGVVLVLHILIFWAINSGLARKFVKVVKGPVETLLLEDAKPDIPPPPPPPPPKNLPPPPPAFVPPPMDIPQVASPAPTMAITAVSNTPPPVAAPPPPPAPPAPPPPPAPAVRVPPVINAAQNCQKPEYPSASRRAEEEGTVYLKFLVGVDGRALQSEVEKSSGFPRLDEAARQALSRCQFKPGTLDGKPVESWTGLKYTWRLE